TENQLVAPKREWLFRDEFCYGARYLRFCGSQEQRVSVVTTSASQTEMIVAVFVDGKLTDDDGDGFRREHGDQATYGACDHHTPTDQRNVAPGRAGGWNASYRWTRAEATRCDAFGIHRRREGRCCSRGRSFSRGRIGGRFALA